VTLHAPAAFARHIGRLPATQMVEQWDAHVAKVGDKVFALLGRDGGHIIFKVNEIAFEGLTALEGIAQAPYFAKRSWVAVARGALAERDLKAYIAASHRLVAGKLTRKARAALGLTDL
jgi:predicted DNA-binding protein (MmcQ/YjbR family)